MPYQDLRALLSVLKQSGELVDIARPISLKYEVGKALAKTSAVDGPALMFNKTESDFPLVAGLYGNRKRALIAFEATEATIHDRVIKAIDNPIGPIDFSGPPPCQEVVLTGDDIDLTKLPVPIYSPKDGGPYITSGILVSEDPDTGIPDIGNYCFQVHGARVLGLFSATNHRFGKNIAKAIERKVPLHGAIVIGVDPMTIFACQVQAGDSSNDWLIAGGLRRTPIELAKMIGGTLEVPAYAEFIIEFTVDSDDQRIEGPLGEYTATIPRHRSSRRRR